MPAGKVASHLAFGNLGLEASAGHAVLLELFEVLPVPDRKPGEIGRTESRGLHVFRLLNGNAQQVSLKLHDKVVARGAAVNRKNLQLDTGIELHGVQNIETLIRHGLAGSTYNRRTVCRAGEPADRTARVGVPPWGAQAAESRHEIAPAVVFQALT